MFHEEHGRGGHRGVKYLSENGRDRIHLQGHPETVKDPCSAQMVQPRGLSGSKLQQQSLAAEAAVMQTWREYVLI